MRAAAVDSDLLLEAVHRIAKAGRQPLEAIVRYLAEVSGDTVAAFVRGPEGGRRLSLVALHDVDSDRAARVQDLLAPEGAADGVLGTVLIIGRPQILEVAPWPRIGYPVARAMLVPIRASGRVVGALVYLRDPTKPAHSGAERHAAEAIAILIGSELRTAAHDRHLAAAREEFELFRGSLRILGGQLDSGVALQPLAVQARHGLGARAIAIFTMDHPGASLRLVAGAGLGGADALNGALPEGIPLLERTLADRGAHWVADLAAQADAEPLRLAFGRDACVLALPLVIRQDPLGILVAAWSAEVPPSPEVRAFAAQVAELATLLAAHASLARQAVEARSNERLASALASQRDGLVRQIVHDLRNAVHILGLAAEEIDRKAADPVRVRAALSPLARQADFMAAYLEKQLRSLDEDSLEAPSPASLEAAFKHAGGELGRHVAEHGRRLKVGTCQPATLRIGQVQLTEILAGLIRAAVPLADPGGALELWAAVSDGWATIILEEDGPSLDRDDRAPPLASAHGSGGLAEVEELVAAAGGHFGVRSRPGERMSFHIGLPTVDWGGGALQ